MHEASAAVQSQVAGIYSGIFAPVFAALAVTYAAGVVAAVLLPAGRLSDESEPAPAPSSEPLTA